MRFVTGALFVAVLLWLLAPAWPERTAASQQGVDPPNTEITLAPGASGQIEKTVDVPAVPAVSDVLIAFDLTGSMGGELSNLQLEVQNIIDDLSAAVPDLQMGLVSFEDYPGFFDSSTDPSGCDYADDYGTASDDPFRVDQPITADFNAVKTAADGMVLGSGWDGPEAYARVLWETAQADSGIGFRPGAARFVVMFLDNIPHDCDLNEGITSPPITPLVTGIDPGRNATIDFGGDDIDWQDDALAGAAAVNVRFSVIESNGAPCDFETYYSTWTQLTGGAYACINSDGSVPGGLSLSDTILAIIGEAFASVDVTLVPVGCDPILLTFDPPSHEGVETPNTVSFTETVTVPDGAPPGTYTCSVEARMDEAVLGEQELTVHVSSSAPTPTPSATPTQAPSALPPTGGRADSDGLPWLALAAGALALIGSSGTWLAYQRRRAR
ncbi:MAG: hypothetical protein Q7R32_04695 [Dehalococcoidia bacterium]|nr:hypothetical protein [Dehalococcoidia bacterium]